MAKLRRIMPWLLAAILFTYLFSRYSVQEVLAAASHLNVLYFLVFLCFYFIYMSLADAGSLQLILNRFGIEARFKKILKLRLASYLMMILNYGVGQGVLAYYIKRQYKVPFAKVSSVLLYIIMMDLYWALTIASVGSFFVTAEIYGHDLVLWIRALWLGASLLLLALFIFWRLPIQEEKLQWLRVRNLFHTFHRARLSDYVMVMLWRFPLHCATSTYLYFLALCFGVSIPFAKVVMLLPMAVVIGAIPITPSGIGTIQLACIVLFQDHVSGGPVAIGHVSGAEIIFSMSLLFTLGIYSLKLLSGVIFYRVGQQETKLINDHEEAYITPDNENTRG